MISGATELSDRVHLISNFRVRPLPNQKHLELKIAANLNDGVAVLATSSRPRDVLQTGDDRRRLHFDDRPQEGSPICQLVGHPTEARKSDPMKGRG